MALALAGLLVGFLGLRPGPARLRPGVTDVVNADRPGINAHNSPAAAVDPVHPATIALADRIDTPRFSCSVSLSTTAGDSWRPLSMPLPPDAPNCHQPDVAYDAAGRLLVLYTATGGRFNQPVGIWLQRFDGEAPAGAAVHVGPAEAFHAHLTVDGERVWVSWVQVDGAAELPLGFTATPGPVRLVRSDDGGGSFAAPVTVGEPGTRLVEPTPVALGGDRVVVGALDLGADRLDYEAGHGGQGGPPSDDPWRVATWTSTDGGATFAPGVTVASGLVAPQRIIVNLAPAPSFARDPSRDGRLYATWDAGRGDGRDVFLARSDDGGATWSPAVDVAPRPRGQLLPAVGVSRSGRVDLVFYDRSADPQDHLARVAMASSSDGGRTFRTATVSGPPFDTRIGFGSLQGIPVLGSRLAVLPEGGRSRAFWADTSRGTIDDNIADLATVSVDMEAVGRRRPLLVAGGLLLLGLGGGLALVVGFRPGDRRPQQA
ncbi:MAG: glycoside hydrolase [Actinomycetota bacterium]|nr:glycoside hydrolase [Actinomycetota bacterium]